MHRKTGDLLNRKLISLLLLSSLGVAIVYFVGSAVVSGSSIESAVNTLYPIYKKNPVQIQEFNASTYCLKGFGGTHSYASGAELYEKNCIYCHSTITGGDSDLLPLHEIVDRLGQTRISEVVKNGRGQMPVYGFVLSDEEIAVISKYLLELHSISKTE